MEFSLNRKRRIPDVVCDCSDLTGPDGHLYTQDELDVHTINNPDGSMATIDWNLQKANRFRKNIWESIRTTGIGGSEVAVLLGDSHWQTPLELYFNKIGKLPIAEAKKETTQKEYLFDFGHKMEEFVAEQFVKRMFYDKYKDIFEVKFSEKYGENIIITDVECLRDTKMYRCPECPCLIADFDFLVRFTTDSGKVLEGIFECKTSSPYQIKDKWEEGFPSSYYDQVSNYMLVGDYDFFVIACAADNSYQNYYAHLGFRDEEMDKKIMDAANDFWHNHVLPEIPPPIGNQNVLEALKKYIEPDETQEQLDLTGLKLITSQADKYFSAKEEESKLRKEADLKKEEAEAALSKMAVFLKTSPKGLIKTSSGDLYVLEHTIAEKTSFTAAERKKMLQEHPELKTLVESYYKKSTSASFKLSKKKAEKKKKTV